MSDKRTPAEIAAEREYPISFANQAGVRFELNLTERAAFIRGYNSAPSDAVEFYSYIANYGSINVFSRDEVEQLYSQFKPEQNGKG